MQFIVHGLDFNDTFFIISLNKQMTSEGLHRIYVKLIWKC